MKIIKLIKSFFISRPLIRFYRVVGFGFLSVVLLALLELIPQLSISPEISGFAILILTGALNAVDKYRRNLKKKE